MRVLMLGWEFPPEISGGLGTACEGIVRGLVGRGVQVRLVLPRLTGTESERGVQFVSASDVPIEASGAEIVTVAIRRTDLNDDTKDGFWANFDREKCTILPNTAGCFDVKSAVTTARKDLQRSDPESPLMTMDGDVVGTPAYMAPEQARGELDRIGPRSDVYAIGAMIYHLLSRATPYVPDDGRVSPRQSRAGGMSARRVP